MHGMGKKLEEKIAGCIKTLHDKGSRQRETEREVLGGRGCHRTIMPVGKAAARRESTKGMKQLP